MYILIDGDSQQLALPWDLWQRMRILLCKQMTALMPFQRLDSALDVSRPAQHECKKNVRGLYSRRLLPKVPDEC